MPHTALRPLAGAALAALLGTAQAQGLDWSLCAAPDVVPAVPDWEGPLPVSAGDFEAYADQVVRGEAGVSELQGDVRALQNGERLHAGRMIHYDAARSVDLMEGLRYWSGDTYLSGSRGHYELDTGEGWVDDASLRVGSHHGRGGGSTVRFTGSEILLVEDATYTTCDPGSEAWRLEARTLEIDRGADMATARGVRLRWRGVPVLYSPWLRFPLSDARKTGFLQPAFGDGTETGFEVTVPFYWNIAPERDATFAVRAMADRGAMLMGEYRYLMPRGRGQLNLEYLPEDDITGESRGLVAFDHRQRLGARWDALVDFQEVSDSDYLQELGTELAVSATRFLRRRAQLAYSGAHWRLLGRVDDYQTVDETIAEASRPYRRLPQLVAGYRHPTADPDLELRMDGELVAFDQDARVDGVRVDLTPSVAYDWRTPGAFLRPRASLRHTRYDLSDPAGGDERLTRTLPVLSVDSGVFLERDLALGGRDWVQTLEPRVFYLYVPFRDQDDIPRFDTGRYTFGFAQLFRENRFSGADRVGDANQVSLAVTSRLLAADSGRELVRGTIGRIFFLEDREVTLAPDGAPETTEGSDVVAEVAAELARGWSAGLGLQWDPTQDQLSRGTFRARYQPNADAVLNASYRFVRDRLEQVDLSGRWPVNHRLALVARWNWEVPEQRLLEGFAGLEYNSCCWAVRALAQRFLNNDTPGEEEYSTGVFLQLELKGLAGLGDETARLLRQQIPGYRNTF